MPYDIYVLDKTNVTVTGGQLDGVTQGDGSHLVGLTLTLTTPAWYSVSVNDNDANFDDNDGNQTLIGTQVINGVSYTGNKVEAEFSFVVTDGINSWTMIAFNVNNSNPPFGTIEAVAVIGGPGGFPPAGVALTVLSAAEGPSYDATTYATPICFGSGTLIATPQGKRQVEDLGPGDLVLTVDHGPQPVRWHAARRFVATSAVAPICLAPGVIGNTRPLILSPQHRVLVEGWRSELFFGEAAMLVPAKAFLGYEGAVCMTGGTVTYHHLMFDRHEMLWSEGAVTESFYPGDAAVESLTASTRAELLRMFPELCAGTEAYGPLARPALRKTVDAAVLAA